MSGSRTLTVLVADVAGSTELFGRLGVDRADAAGALRSNAVADIPDAMKGGVRDGDDRYETLTARRPVMEAALAGAARAAGIDIRRGAAVESLLSEGATGSGPPHVTGVCLASGEAMPACTNPSVGRGSSIGLLHGVALRDVLRDADLDDRVGTALAFDAATQQVVEPWYRATLDFDRHRLADIEAHIASETYDPGDPTWELTNALLTGAGKDPDLLRAALGVAGMLVTGEEALAAPGIMEKAIEHGGNWRQEPLPGPTRSELVALAAG